MKKFLLLSVFAVAIVFSSIAQHNATERHGDRQKISSVKNHVPISLNRSVDAVVFEEDFSNDSLAYWTVMGEGADNWSTVETNQAGGEAPEAEMYFSPIFTGTTRLVSPVINTSGHTTLILSFLHVLEVWSGGGNFWVAVETTSDGGTTWNQVWELYWDSTDDYYAMEFLGVNTADVGSDSFQFCFKFEDNSDLLDWWRIDNIILEEPYTYDVATTAILGLDDIINDGDDVMVAAEVTNFGTETVTFDVNLAIDDGTSVIFDETETVTDLVFGESIIVDFNSWTAVEGNYTATVNTLLTGDENTANDEIVMPFTVYGANTYCFPSGDCSYADGFIDFAFAGIENYESGCSDNGYGNFTYMEGAVEIGSTYTATMASGYSSNYVSMWIDFNLDYVFSDNERVLTDFLIPESNTLTDVDVIIPGYGLPGTTTMRIGANYGDISSPDPCADFVYGEWEDYTLVVSGTPISYDAVVVSIDITPILPQGDVTPKATVFNNGTETISFPITCSTDGYTSTVNITDLGSGEQLQVEFDTWSATPGAYDFEVVTALEGDEIPGNDMVNKSITIVEYVPTKIVVGEEGTGTWCGWCVRGAVYMDSMAMKYPDTWIGIAVHNGDPMVVDEYDAGIGPLIGYAYPGGIVDRSIGTDPSYFEAAYLERINRVAAAGIIIENKSFNAATGELTFTLTSDFVATVSDYRFNAVIVENGVTGEGDGWDQANYYSGGGNGPMGGYENLPDPVPAELMVYEHVARAILGGFAGAEGSLPATVNAGETHSYEFTTTLSEDWDINHIKIVGMLIDNATGEIVNGIKDELIITDISNQIASNTDLILYPNPARDAFKIANITGGDVYVYNMNGQLLLEEKNVSGTTNIDVSNFMNGTYIIRVIMDNQAFTSKLNIIK